MALCSRGAQEVTNSGEERSQILLTSLHQRAKQRSRSASNTVESESGWRVDPRSARWWPHAAAVPAIHFPPKDKHILTSQSVKPVTEELLCYKQMMLRLRFNGTCVFNWLGAN